MGELAEDELPTMNPICEIFFACCASTVTETASNAPANRIDLSAVFLNGRLISGVIYHADGSKEKRYLRAPLLSGFNAIIANKALTRITRDAFDLNDGSANSDEKKQKAGVCPQGGRDSEGNS